MVFIHTGYLSHRRGFRLGPAVGFAAQTTCRLCRRLILCGCLVAPGLQRDSIGLLAQSCGCRIRNRGLLRKSCGHIMPAPAEVIFRQSAGIVGFLASSFGETQHLRRRQISGGRTIICRRDIIAARSCAGCAHFVSEHTVFLLRH
jgi:hypothetical protein